MTMTHKEALQRAHDAYCRHETGGWDDDFIRAIRAYVEARGLVMVPMEATTAMIAAACDVWGVRVDEDVKRNITEEIKVALSAAPDPFTEE